LLQLRKEIRGKDYSKLKLKCYLCDSNVHIAPDCTKLKSFDEYFKFNFKDKKHKTEAEIKKVYDLISRNSGSTQLIQTYQYLNLNTSNPSFTKNTKDSFFSYAGVYSDDEEAQDEQLSDFDANRFIRNEEENENKNGEESSSSSSCNSISGSGSGNDSVTCRSNKSESNKTDNPHKSTKSVKSVKSNNSIRSLPNETNSLKKSISNSKIHSEKNSFSSKHSKIHSERNSSNTQHINNVDDSPEPENILTNEEKENLNKNTNDNELLTLDDNRTKFGKLLQISQGKKKKF